MRRTRTLVIGTTFALLVAGGTLWWCLRPAPPLPGPQVAWRALVSTLHFQACDVSDGETFVIARNGLDEHQCTVVCPCQTYARVLTMMDGDDTLYLRGGTYGKALLSRVFVERDVSTKK